MCFAPSSLAIASLESDEEVEITVQPKREAIWITKVETPPVPCVRIVIVGVRGMGPKKRALMAVPPQAGREAI